MLALERQVSRSVPPAEGLKRDLATFLQGEPPRLPFPFGEPRTGNAAEACAALAASLPRALDKSDVLRFYLQLDGGG